MHQERSADADLPHVIANMLKDDNALRQKCLYYSAHQAQQRAQARAQLEQQRLEKALRSQIRAKRKRGKMTSKAPRGDSKPTASLGKRGLDKPLNVKDDQCAAEDIFKQLVGEG